MPNYVIYMFFQFEAFQVFPPATNFFLFEARYPPSPSLSTTANLLLMAAVMNSSSNDNGPASEPTDQVLCLGPPPTFVNNL